MKHLITMMIASVVLTLPAVAQEDSVLLAAVTPRVIPLSTRNSALLERQVGDSCTYTQRDFLKPGVTYREVVTAVLPTEVQVRKEGMTGRFFGAVTLTLEGNPLATQTVDKNWVRQTSEKRYFNPPHTAGKRWANEYVAFSSLTGKPDGAREVVKQTATVIGPEVITVPAGTFSVVHIRYAGWVQRFDQYQALVSQSQYNEEIWYAEDTRCVVRLTRVRTGQTHYVRELLDWHRPGMNQ